MKYRSIFLSILAIFAFNYSAAQAQDKQPVEIKLYAIDCGRIDISNLAGFSDTGAYDNKSTQLADPCFLIVHPKGTLLWDTGLPDSLIKKSESKDVFTLSKTTSLPDSLKQLNLKPSDITYVTISHSHFDHTGDLDQFPHSTWILQKAEVAYSKTHPNPYVVDLTTLKNWGTVHKLLISGDYDVFGDGTVRILNTPGHTPGHQSLMVTLPKAGVIILSGDEFHQRASVDPLKVPVFNASRADTMASADRIKGLMKNSNAQLVVQHDKNDFEKLPKFPNYLD